MVDLRATFGDTLPEPVLENDPVVGHLRGLESTAKAVTDSSYQNLSKLLRASLFPGAVSKFPTKSAYCRLYWGDAVAGVTQDMLEGGRRQDLVGTHQPDKTYNRRQDKFTNFFEAEFHRRNLMKAQDKQKSS